MICYQCQSSNVRLSGLAGYREIWACQDCGQSLAKLDCHYCERRGVYKLTQGEQGAVSQWCCEYCHIAKSECPLCQKAWLDQNGVCPRCRG